MDAEPSLEELRSEIEEMLTTSLEAQWEDVLHQWQETAPSRPERGLEGVNDLRDRMLEVLLESESKNDLQRRLVFQYVAIKGQWATLLAQIQSQTENQQDTERLIRRASCISLLIQRLESLLCWKDLREVTAFLNAPLCAQVGTNSAEGRFGGGPIDES